MKCPSEIYVPSERTYCDQFKKYEYDGKHHVIKVNSWGYARFGNWQVYLSETMMNEYNIEFTPDKSNFLNTIIMARNITEAYLEFVKRFPKEYIIVEITGAR
jgi:hypothetical protein